MDANDTRSHDRRNAKRDDAISRGFDAGNYANAYETTDLETALAKLSPNRSAEYVAAFTLGFFSSYELSEMGSDSDAYLEAWSLVGERAMALGIAVDPPELQECADCGADTSEPGKVHSCG